MLGANSPLAKVGWMKFTGIGPLKSHRRDAEAQRKTFRPEDKKSCEYAPGLDF
jgi:hypothetical protein